MKVKTIVLLIAISAILLTPSMGRAKGTYDEKIEKLEKEIQELKEQQKSEREKIPQSKFPIKLYGFVAAQPTWASAKTTLSGTRNSAAAMSSIKDKTANPANGNAWFGFTIQNSRLGLLWTGSDVGKKTKIGGVFEIDFVNIIDNASYGTSPLPRIRLFSFDIWGDRWSLLAGQNWDIFSPLNTKSLSLGNNLWFQGNMGFRRPQVRFTYNFPFGVVNNLKVSASIDHPSNTDNLYAGGAESAYPYGEWQVAYSRKMKYGDFVIAASGVGGVNRLNSKNNKMYGFAGSLNFPVCKFVELTGEFQWGQDLGDFLSLAGTTTKARNIAVWGQASSRWHKKFETNFGYGIDNIQTSKIAAGAVQRNQIVFGNVKYWPVEPFYIGVEYEYMRTNYKMNGASAANALFANLVYMF